MAVETIYFFAPLANARGHFRSLKPPHPFRVERWRREKIIDTWRRIERLPKIEFEILYNDHGVGDEYAATAHVVTGQVEADARKPLIDRLGQFDGQDLALERWLRAVRLVVCGNVDTVGEYWYLGDGRKLEMISMTRPGWRTQSDISSVSPRNIPTFTAWIDKVLKAKLQDYVALSLQHWDLSFRQQSNELEFLQLMMALEVLFNVGAQDIRYRISRSLAVLVGKSAEESEEVFKRAKNFYDLRSQLVHTGKTKEPLHPLTYLSLRRMVRDAILALMSLGAAKDKMAHTLTAKGFGDSPAKQFLVDV